MVRLLLPMVTIAFAWCARHPPALETSGTPLHYDTVVAADGTGQFTSVQQAIMAAPHLASPCNPWVILVRPGVYRERVYVQRERGCIRLVGTAPEETVITYDLHAKMTGLDGKEIGTFRTPTVVIDGDHFVAENLTIENAAGPVAQAVALRVDGDRVILRNCRLLGWQDTVFLNRGSAYFQDCYIAGHVDFIFGGGTAFFEHCHIHCRADGYITAASTPAEQPFGFVFSNCTITGEPGVRTYLGQPWRKYAAVAFLKRAMSEVIRPEGWHDWGKLECHESARFAEWKSTGPGAQPERRVPWARQLTNLQARRYTPESWRQRTVGTLWAQAAGDKCRPHRYAADLARAPLEKEAVRNNLPLLCPLRELLVPGRSETCRAFTKHGRTRRLPIRSSGRLWRRVHS
ncbi:MAG: pectinesterase family protein [Candidatus Oleimicrobiaceae bacterium]